MQTHMIDEVKLMGKRMSSTVDTERSTSAFTAGNLSEESHIHKIEVGSESQARASKNFQEGKKANSKSEKPKAKLL